MATIILDQEAYDKFTINTEAISKVTEQLKKDSKNPKKAKGKKQKHNFVSNF